MEKLNPIDDSRKKLDKYRDYPRFKLSEYDSSAPLSTTTWKIEDDDIAAVEAKLGKGALKSLDIDITLKHDGKQSWGIELDHHKVTKHLLSEAGCDASEQEQFVSCKNSDELAATATAMGAEASERVKTLITKLAEFRGSKPTRGALDILAPGCQSSFISPSMIE